LLLLLLSWGFTGIAYAQPQLESDTGLSTEGYFQLSWHSEQPGNFELQQSPSEDFHLAHSIYRGQDMATVISGLPNGRYFYRVRQEDNPIWSDPVRVEVKHHPLSRAFGFFSLGAVMFLATLVVLIRGARSQRPS
jgi:hypothetical protein